MYVQLALTLLAFLAVFRIRAARLRSARPWSGDIQIGIFDNLDGELTAFFASEDSVAPSDAWPLPLAA